MDKSPAAEGAPSTLLPVYCPIPPAIHPQVDRMEREAIAWIDRFALPTSPRERQRMIGTRSAEWACRLTPDAVAERLQLTVRWTYWGFLFDDVYCDSAQACSRPQDFMQRVGNLIQMVEHPHRPPHGSDPFTLALNDIVQDLLRMGATATQMSRLIHAHRAWLFAAAWQMTNQHHGTVPTVNDYLTIRQRTIGGEIYVALFDFLHAQELHDRDFHDPAVRALTEMMFFLGGIDNDLQSPPAKDAIEENHTIFSVLMQEEGIDHTEARYRAVAMRDRVTCRFLHLRDRIAARAGKELRQYLDCLSHTIRGNLDWGASVPRYTGMSPRTARYTHRPPGDADLPLPYSVTNGWWDPALA